MIINPVTITMSKHEADRVWSVVDKRIKALGKNSAERRVLEQALDASGPPSPPQRRSRQAGGNRGNMETTQRVAK